MASYPADEGRVGADGDPFADLVAELADFRRGVSRRGTRAQTSP